MCLCYRNYRGLTQVYKKGLIERDYFLNQIQVIKNMAQLSSINDGKVSIYIERELKNSNGYN